MSYSNLEARSEQNEQIHEATDARDSEALYQIARTIKKQGDDEGAEALVKQARQIDLDDMAYDMERDNNLN